MTWPEAFALVGGGVAFVALMWVLTRPTETYTAVRSRPVAQPPMWTSTTIKHGDDDYEFLPGWTMKQIAEDPDGYVAAVRKVAPRPPRK